MFFLCYQQEKAPSLCLPQKAPHKEHSSFLSHPRQFAVPHAVKEISSALPISRKCLCSLHWTTRSVCAIKKIKVSGCIHFLKRGCLFKACFFFPLENECGNVKNVTSMTFPCSNLMYFLDIMLIYTTTGPSKNTQRTSKHLPFVVDLSIKYMYKITCGCITQMWANVNEY